MVGCIASLSLLLGGGTVFAFNHINQSSQADSVATTASIKEEAQEQARKEYEQQLEELLNRTNGQPMNDKRNGHSWFRQQERIENKVQSLREEIKQQEKQVEKLERQEELKEMGYNKYGGLDMTIENIPRIKEEIERFEKGESTFSAATIRKYQRKLESYYGHTQDRKQSAINEPTGFRSQSQCVFWSAAFF
ncbi:hypothetical protein [Enterococcus faecium]|uniref:hypothetical protein n=1 Tax=Enterococcus faecium TaxID=1352 RepID=UPI001E2F44F0|nr:hypothetical protein [Enterococcus faecium]